MEVTPEACHFDERKFHVKPVRQKWFGCACCPPNLARLLSSIGSYAYTEKEDTLYVHLYIGSTVRKEVQGTTAEVFITSGFPWDGNVSVRVKGTAKPFTLALRIPDWCADKYQVSGTEGAVTRMEDGYLYVTKAWSENDSIELNFSMNIQLYEADSRVREDIGKVAVMRGPVVYCLEEADNGKDLHLLGLDLDAEPQVEEREIEGNVVRGIAISGFRQEPVYIKGHELYRIAQQADWKPVRLRFVPYYTWANRGENEMAVWVRRA